MVYSTIPTLTDTALSAANFNAYLRDNQIALKDPPSQNYESNEGADYTTLSTTYGAVDADYSFSITTTGGDVICGFMGTCSAFTEIFDISVDGTRIANHVDGYLARTGTGVNAFTITFVQLITGLSAGVHTFSLHWRVTVAGTATLYAGAGTASFDLHPQFWARELS